MPVIRIQAIRTPDLAVPALLTEVSSAVAQAFSIDRRQCWSCFSEIHAGEYYEGGSLRGATGRHSPLVAISAAAGRSSEQIAAALDGAAAAVVAHFGFAHGDVFVEYRELAAGTVHTGGEVR